MSWSVPCRTIQAVAVSLGNAALVGLCKIYAVDFKQYEAGAPDLCCVRGFRSGQTSGCDLASPVEYVDWSKALGSAWRLSAALSAMDEDLTCLVVPEGKLAGQLTAAAAEGDEEDATAPCESSAGDLVDDACGAICATGELGGLERENQAFCCDEENLDLPLDPVDGSQWTYECLLVEVKGPSDKLSARQTKWMRALASAGIHAVVCRVKEGLTSQDKGLHHTASRTSTTSRYISSRTHHTNKI